MRLHSATSWKQRGVGMIGLLLALLVIGILAYYMLKGGKNNGGGSDTGNAVHCEQQIQKIVSATGGIGAQAQAQYDALPDQCKKLMPNPSALTPSVQQPQTPSEAQ